MKRFVRFLSIFLIMGLATIAVFSIKPKATANTSYGFVAPLKFYFKDYNYYYDNDDYEFDFTFIPITYDYIIFNFGDNVARDIYLMSTARELFVNTGVGIHISNRSDLIWSINFDDITNNFDYYFIAYNYNQIINIEDYLTDFYNYGYNNGSDDGYDTGYGRGYDNALYNGYITGYDDGLDDGYITGYDTGYDEGYADGSEGAFDEGYAQARDEFGAYIDDKWQGYNDGYDYGYDLGYYLGYNESGNLGFADLIGQVFVGLGSFLSIELLPNITFGAIFAVPLVFGIIFFIIGRRGGKDD